MKKASRFAAVAIAALAAAGLYVRKRNTLADVVSELPDHETPVDPDLRQFLIAVNTVNDVTDPGYTRAVASMRHRSAEVLGEIERLAREVPGADYPMHRCLVLAAGALQDPATLAYLRGVVFRPWPTSSPATHRVEDQVEETALRSLAVEAIEQLAADSRNVEAMDALTEVVSVPSLTLRTLALVALRAVDGTGQYFERAAAMLPKDQKYLLDARRVKVTDVSQIPDPRVHLLGPELGVPGRPPLREDAPSLETRPVRPGRGGAPRVSGGG